MSIRVVTRPFVRESKSSVAVKRFRAFRQLRNPRIQWNGEAIARLGTFRDCGIPEPVPGKRWLGFTCPFCGKDRAAMSYEAGYFECYHADCRKRISVTGDSSIVGRFWPQIMQAASNLRAKFLYLFGSAEMFRDARNHAAERVVIYAGERNEHDADAGMLGKWEADVIGDPDQLDRFVLRALNMDLLDYAKSRVRQNRNEHDRRLALFRGDLAGIPHRGLPGGQLDGYPLLKMRYGQDLTQREIAKTLQVSVKTIKRRMASECKRYKRDHGLAA